MKAITIYKASAGTGKTYTLAARYIALLLQDIPASSILAVTFTNKATAEMKQRIIEYLYAIGQSLPEADGVRQTILQFLPAPTPRYPYNQPEFISSQAQRLLRAFCSILTTSRSAPSTPSFKPCFPVWRVIWDTRLTSRLN